MSMGTSYTRNYIKIYLTQGVSILLGILSLLIVVPHVSSDKDIYGIYSLCISTLMFLSYADIGFLSAGIKYAAEYFALGRSKDELGVIGFSAFVLLIFVCFISLIYVVLGFAPELLITGIGDTPTAYHTARSLFFIMAVFAPSIVVQKLAHAIYNIRVKDYVNQYITIAGNVLKILSVYFFFGKGRYMLIEYFFFLQFISLLSAVVSLIIARYKYKVDIGFLLRSLRWSTKYFNHTKKLAVASFISTLAWVAYYELDQVFIAKFFGSSAVAIFSVAFTLLSYIRTLYGAYFSPFSARINHLKVLPDRKILQNFFLNIVRISIPVAIIPQLALWMYAKDFVICWSGPQYLESVSIAKLLIFCNLLAFISYPGGLLLTALEKHKVLRYTSICAVIIYWSGILLLKQDMGVQSFAIMKLVVFWSMAIVYLAVIYRFLKISFGQLFKMLFYPIVSCVIIVALFAYLLHFNIALDKGFANLLLVCVNIVVVVVVSSLLFVLLNKYFREFIVSRFKSFMKK